MNLLCTSMYRMKILYIFSSICNMSKLKRFFNFLDRAEPFAQDNAHKTFVLEKSDIPFKSKSTTIKNFITYLDYIVCSSHISAEYLKSSYRDASHIILLLSKDMAEIHGICFLSFHDYEAFVQRNSSFVQNYHGLHLDPQIATMHRVVYIHVLCSKPKTKCGEKLLRLLTHELYRKYDYQAVTLHSLPDTYAYYVKQGFYRTNNLQDIFPAFETDGRLLFDNSNNINIIRSKFPLEPSSKYSYFQNEFQHFFTNFNYLFMKPINIFYGGFKRSVLVISRKVLESPRRRSLGRTRNIR